jgi:hypothetical protein
MKLEISAFLLALGLQGAAEAQPAPPPVDPVTVIHAGTLLAEPGRPARRNASVVVRGRRIAEVRDGFVDLPGARVVDLRDHTVMPGLMDMHVHFRGALDDRIQQRLQASGRDYEDAAFTAQMHAKRTLLAGFTTVRDLGNDPRLVTTLRDAIEGGMFAGPTIVAAGTSVSVSGGHGDPRNGANRDLAEIAAARDINTCNGADDCRRAVRSQISYGVDVIKIAASGGVLSNVPGGLAQQMMDDEIKAVVDTPAASAARSRRTRMASTASTPRCAPASPRSNTAPSPTTRASASTSGPALTTSRPCSRPSPPSPMAGAARSRPLNIKRLRRPREAPNVASRAPFARA